MGRQEHIHPLSDAQGLCLHSGMGAVVYPGNYQPDAKPFTPMGISSNCGEHYEIYFGHL